MDTGYWILDTKWILDTEYWYRRNVCTYIDYLQIQDLAAVPSSGGDAGGSPFSKVLSLALSRWRTNNFAAAKFGGDCGVDIIHWSL